MFDVPRRGHNIHTGQAGFFSKSSRPAAPPSAARPQRIQWGPNRSRHRVIRIVIEQSRVEVQRGIRLIVAQHPLQREHRGSLRHSKRGGRVPELVRSQPTQLRGFAAASNQSRRMFRTRRTTPCDEVKTSASSLRLATRSFIGPTRKSGNATLRTLVIFGGQHPPATQPEGLAAMRPALADTRLGPNTRAPAYSGSAGSGTPTSAGSGPRVGGVAGLRPRRRSIHAMR